LFLTERNEGDGKDLGNEVLGAGLEKFDGDVDVHAEPADLGSGSQN
jgi:hypothetical protein